jgi:tetratricopeptide (TPR) repeat protein
MSDDFIQDFGEEQFADDGDGSWDVPEDEAPEVAYDEPEFYSPFDDDAPPKPSLWQGFLKRFFPTKSDREEKATERLRELDDLIAVYPTAPMNYVLRGELFYDVRQYELALPDFQRAVELAQDEFDHADWGIAAQVVGERALVGLKRTQNRLKNMLNSDETETYIDESHYEVDNAIEETDDAQDNETDIEGVE